MGRNDGIPQLDGYRESLTYFLGMVSHLGVTAVLADLPSASVRRTELVLQRIHAEVRTGKMATRECLEGIGAQLAIVQGQPPTIEELLWAYDASRTFRKRAEKGGYASLNEEQRILLQECEAINRETWRLCEERVERAGRDLKLLEQSTIQVADLGGVLDRRAVPSGLRVFISYAHEDKGVAEFIERRLRNGGISTWRDERSMIAGSSLPAEVVGNIQKCSHFCVITSPDSKKSRWVEQESSWALTSELENGSPRIIPILHNEKKPALNLSDRLAINFVDWEKGMSELWAAIGITNRTHWSLSEVGKLLRRGKKLLKAVEWCGTADGWLTVHEDTFEELEESESYLTSLGLPPTGHDLMRFARTRESYSENAAQAVYSEEFYGFTNSYVAGTVLLERFADLVEGLLGRIAPAEPMKSRSASQLT